MKTIRLFIGALSLVFAFASAFALKSSHSLITPSYIDPVNGCTQESVTCNGDKQDCVVSGKIRYDFQADADCGPVLKMP